MVILEISTVSRSVEVVTIQTRTMVSSVIMSLTFVQIEMPVYVTVVSQIVLAMEMATPVAATQVSNATLIGGVSGGFVLLVGLVAFGLWFKRQEQNDKAHVIDMDMDYLDDDIVSSTSRSITVDGDGRAPGTKKAKKKQVERMKVREVINAFEEEEDHSSEAEERNTGDEAEPHIFQLPEECRRASRRAAPAVTPTESRQGGRRLTIVTIGKDGAPQGSPDIWL
jgi:hypothetical protein